MAEAATPVVRPGWPSGAQVRVAGLFILAFVLFAGVLLAAAKNPLRAYADILSGTLLNRYGLSEVVVKMIPLLLTALAVAIPSRVWLINIGGEGQLYVGALAATWAATTAATQPGWIALPIVAASGFLGGALWAGLPGWLRMRGWVSETISTLLLNYVGILLVSFFVFGPWKDPGSANYPQSVEFPAVARLPSLFGTRIHLGLLVAIAGLILYHLFMTRTRWGLEMRAIGGNREAARRCGIPVETYVLMLMLVGGGLAGLAGMAEVSAIQGRLRPSLSPGYGYVGFLISWMAGGSAFGMVAAAFLIAVIAAGGDILQMTHRLPGSAVNILMALMLFVVLARRGKGGSS